MKRLIGLAIVLCGCGGMNYDPAAVANRNIQLVPTNAPGYQAPPDAPLVVVCGKDDPRNYKTEPGWGGETSTRCWYGRPVSAVGPSPASTP